MTGPKEDRPNASLVSDGTYWPHYYSTSCMHGPHDRCRKECKFWSEKCSCFCHRVSAA